MPGLPSIDVAELQKSLPSPLPDEIIELISYSAGFDISPNRSLRFTGVPGFSFASLLPYSVALLGDGAGNFWAADINPLNGAWGPIFFVNHDPPVIVLQEVNVGSFISQLVAPNETSAEGGFDEVLARAVNRIWRADPWLVSADKARSCLDANLSAFVDQLPTNYCIADLRAKEIGSGFAWGRAGADAKVRRAGTALVFAIEQKARTVADPHE